MAELVNDTNERKLEEVAAAKLKTESEAKLKASNASGNVESQKNEK